MKAVSSRKVLNFDLMKLAIDEGLIKEEECLSNVNAIQDALYVLNGKWKLPLIYTLIEKPRRFNEIQQTLQGITPKILSVQLKELEMNGFVKRTVTSSTPLIILYEVTPYSESLKTILLGLRDWGVQHREKIRENMRKAK